MKKILFPVILLTMLIVSAYAYSFDVQNDLQSSLVRLHVVAESDSKSDQDIKYAVRDEILNAVRGISARDTDEFKKAAETAAVNYLEKNNIPYSAKVHSGLYYFPQKQYKNITLPSGEYYGIRVILGSGRGHNWWCVMYPPLCVDGNSAYADRSTLSKLRSELNPDTCEIILGSSNRIRFKLLELLH